MKLAHTILAWLTICLTAVWSAVSLAAQLPDQPTIYMPLVLRAPEPPPPPPTPVEFRGLWVTRFDWTSYGQPAQPDKITEIVENAAHAGFNAILFQVRGTADAFYTPGLEPWSARLTGDTLGQDPGWDPLQHLIDRAHAHDIQIHAYMNVYPLWDCLSLPAADTTPQHLYYQVRDQHGTTNGHLNGTQWAEVTGSQCGAYLRTTPASYFVDDHLVAVAQDLVTRYELDGLHLDHIRYGGDTASCDPVSLFYWGQGCFSAGYAAWQRQQVNGTVARFYNDVILQNPEMMLSAAVWPIHIDHWGWGGRQGYHDYYQDSKAWLGEGYIDAILPMIYPANYDTDSFWTADKWQTLVSDFHASANGRWVLPGIGTGYDNFEGIATRIEMGREIGVVGHALFSYRDLAAHDYFDDLADGPYAEPALAPTVSWHP